MATWAPRIYWYPDPTGTLETLTLSHISTYDFAPVTTAADAQILHGGFHRSFNGASYQISLVSERFTDDTMRLGLEALHAHLVAGGSVGVSLDHTKTWGALCGSTVTRGDALVYVGLNGFSAWSSAGALAAADEFVIESPAPDSRMEPLVVTTATVGTSSGVITPTASPRYTYAQKPFVRYRWFWPVCRMPVDAPNLVENDGWRNFRMNLTLRYSPSDVIALFNGYRTPYSGALPLRGSLGDTTYATGASLDSAIKIGKGGLSFSGTSAMLQAGPPGGGGTYRP
jgi:hypothetical protein